MSPSGSSWLVRAEVLVVLLPLTGLLAPDPASAQSTCLVKQTAKFTPPVTTRGLNVTRPSSGGPTRWMAALHESFAEVVLPMPAYPDALVMKEHQIDTSGLWALLSTYSGLMALVVAGLVLAVAVPSMGLSLLTMRCLCGCCGGWSIPETRDDLSMRDGCSCFLFILYSGLLLLLVFAIFSYKHVPNAIDSFKTQTELLADNLPQVLARPLNELDVLFNTNYDEFSKPLIQRLVDCTKDIQNNAPLAAFITTSAKRFESIQPLLVQLESAAADLKHAADSTKTDVQKAFTELEKAVSHCSPPQCDVSDVEGFKGATEDFETKTEVSVSNVEQLKDELKNADIKQLVSQVPDVASLQEKMDELRVGLGSYLGTVRAALDLTRAKMNSTADLFIAGLRKLQDDPPSELKDLASVYEHSLTTIVVVMGVNVAIYIVGNHCSCSARRSGVCSYHAGAWLLSFGALLFLLSFWAPIIVSSVSLAVSAAFERLVCFPAQNLKSPETRPLIEFGYHWLFGTQGTLAKNESSSSKPSSKPLFDGRHDEGQPFSKQRRQADGVQAAVKQSGTAGRRRAPPVLQAVMEGPLYELETPDTALLDEEPSGNALQSADEDDFEHMFNQGDETTTAYPMPYILRKLLANRDRQDVTAFPAEGSQDTKNKRLPMPAMQSRDQSRDIPKLARRHHEDGHVGDQRKGPGYGSTYLPRHLHSVDYTAGKMTHVTSAKQYGELIGKVETPRAATHHPRKETASGNRLSGKYVRLIRRNIVLEAVESPVLSSQHGDANSGALPEASAVRASYQGTSGAGDVDVVSFPRRRTVLRANRHGSDPKTNATQAAKRISLAAVRYRKDGFWGSEPNALELGRRSEQADVLSDQRSPNARGAIGKNEEKGDEAGADVSWEDALSSDAWKDSVQELSQSAGDGAEEQSAESDGTLTFKALQTLVAPEDIREMAGRFSECERTRAPAFDVVGPKVAEAMAKMLLGVDSPWLGILVGNGQPKFPAVDAMMLNIGQPQTTPAIIETVLGSVADHVITPDDVTNIADKAKSAWKAMQGVVDARKRMKSWIAQPARSGQAKDDVERAGWLLDGISKDKVDAFAKAADKIVAICNGLKDAVTVDNQPLQDYIKQNNARWKNLQDRETAAIGNLTDMASTAKRRLQDDIKQYFDHAKTQLQTNIGECLPLYTLYTTSLAAVCDRGTRPFAAFWMSVYLFFLLGVPAVLTALSVSTYYSRKAPETEPAAAGDEQ